MFSATELAPVEDQSGIFLIVEAPPDASLEYNSIDAGPCRNFGADRHLVFSTHLGCRTADDPPQLDDLYRFE